jgi:hypothetical protein
MQSVHGRGAERGAGRDGERNLELPIHVHASLLVDFVPSLHG